MPHVAIRLQLLSHILSNFLSHSNVQFRENCSESLRNVVPCATGFTVPCTVYYNRLTRQYIVYTVSSEP